MSQPPPDDWARIKELVADALERYFEDLNGQQPADLHELVIAQVERPLFEIVMRQTRGNISRAAELLGMKRPRLSKLVNEWGLKK